MIRYVDVDIRCYGYDVMFLWVWKEIGHMIYNIWYTMYDIQYMMYDAICDGM